MTECQRAELDAIAAELADRNRARNAEARRKFRASFPSEEAYVAYMRELAEKSARKRRENRLARRREQAERELARRTVAATAA